MCSSIPYTSFQEYEVVSLGRQQHGGMGYPPLQARGAPMDPRSTLHGSSGGGIGEGAPPLGGRPLQPIPNTPISPAWYAVPHKEPQQVGRTAVPLLVAGQPNRALQPIAPPFWLQPSQPGHVTRRQEGNLDLRMGNVQSGMETDPDPLPLPPRRQGPPVAAKPGGRPVEPHQLTGSYRVVSLHLTWLKIPTNQRIRSCET